MTVEAIDIEVRRRAFEYLQELTSEHGDALPRNELLRGFEFEGRRVPLLGPQGIFKPAILPQIPLSITTAPLRADRPPRYDDSIRADGLVEYRYRGTDPEHRENTGLRQAMRDRVPLVYFFGLVPGLYAAAWPVFIVGDSPEDLRFTVAVDDTRLLRPSGLAVEEDKALERRRYITRLAVQRLHQHGFRERVLAAYRQCCAVCRLRHRKLLDAAHILGDKDPRGEPFVSNGLALCKIHHAAFDANILGIRPDHVVEIRIDVLREKDGPMLRHGFQELHQRRLLVVPRQRELQPNPEYLAERYERFRKTG
jgi:putative restriction endonuclease